MEQAIALHAKERGVAPTGAKNCARLLEVAYYDLVIVPARPIGVGQRVYISKLKKLPNRYAGPHTPPPQYESCRTDIQGKVVGIRMAERHFTELIVENEITRSLTTTACVAIPHIQGVTIDLNGWWWVLRTTLKFLLPETRRIPMEYDAIVIPDDIEWRDEDGEEDVANV
ncbi:hypothetical protein PYCCODRAFT_1422984 [Trametes coccinea BRFM310]|uniref:Uncharacterized protein n=1 Tax=Trametes coccinea (strain BRFM310) TaxID=1353009 RepID=A0A1Y2IY42_TRAC3|nr:hypothetical protein PYCCODRAFT_1422984 [Trametes coccinea BRFM310]